MPCIADVVICTEYMMTSSNGNIFHVTGHLCGELTGPRAPFCPDFPYFIGMIVPIREIEHWRTWSYKQRECYDEHDIPKQNDAQ